ncbi:uncharacterized protein LOC113229344 isoform X3 [Hyposmocoma kahamanoa]|uniref:uncharacterized protein LOC113229344 isoform X3 n=1 Tax=Hyposmocoma kahamanoa TaxID=1477025 RepID=UPI000E6D9185|nr:uncharacterized protein LOC113229344 isoform X3 [Hyposmocoma kahamanoa]
MATTTKIFEFFRNLKSDAVPKAPRPEKQNPKTNKKNFYSTNKKKQSIPKTDKKTKQHTGFNNVNTQATGNVINIVGSRDLHFGNEFVYYLGPTTMPSNQQQRTEDPDNLKVKKCSLITLLLEAKIKPEYEYLEYISKNLGKNWYSFFRFLGYSQGRIETCEIDEARNGGVSEARYKLLLDWQRNDEDGTLGCLATKLWQHGERQIVKDLALIYNKNHKKL